MKRFFYSIACILLIGSFSLNAQSKEDKAKIKQLEKEYACFSNHKKFFANEKWQFVKCHIVYKLTTAKVAKSMSKNDYVKAKSSSGAYGILVGIDEADLQRITNKVVENFIARMKNEAGVDITSWSNVANSKNAEKIKELAEDPELYSKSQGLGYAISYDGNPVWNKVITIVPGGKKLAKETGRHNLNFSLYIDFAEAMAEANTYVSSKGDWVYWGESAEQDVVPIVQLSRNLGSQSVFDEAGNAGSTMISGQSEVLHTFSMSHVDGKQIRSDVNFATKIESFDGELPAVLENRKNKKVEYVQTFEVHTTPEKYEAAVMDVTNKYFTDFITYYNLVKG